MNKSEYIATILIVDDEEAITQSFACFFEDCGYSVFVASDGVAGLDAFNRHRPDMVFTDLRMPRMDGFEFIARIKQVNPETPVVVISGIGVIADAIKAVKLGAWDFITKPVFNLAELEIITRRALETAELRYETSSLREQLLTGRLNNKEVFSRIVTRDDGMIRIFNYIEAISSTSQPVLIAGQTGTGKELVAQAIHGASKRPGNFVAVNLGGLDDQVFSDTLFGHIRGAFTGADRVRDGMIAQAAGGTLFLDEIGELREASQIKLLRLLQEQEYLPLGSDTLRKTNARIVAATNRDLRIMVEEGRFRQDLYFRLRTHQITLPPLSARQGDIAVLTRHFAQEASVSMGKSTPQLPIELFQYLQSYDFPGNIRELKAMVFDAVACHTSGPLSKESFLNAMGDRRQEPGTGVSATSAECPAFPECFPSGMPTLKEAEELLVKKAMELAEDNQGVAARYLGITRQGLNKMLNRRKNKPSP